MIQSIVYKTVEGCDISLDVHLPDHKTPDALPLLLWFHGGGLLQGSRESVAPHMLRGVEAGRYCLVSIDYRLAPQVNLADIIEDAADATAFVRHKLPAILGPDRIRAEEISVSGSSAGGYLALLLALRDPELRSCLAIYPITEPYESFFTTSQKTLPYDEEELRPYLDTQAQVMSCNAPSSARSKMYFYMLDKANLSELLGIEQCKTGSRARYSVAGEIEALSGERTLCPIYIVHGNADRFVGINQAYLVRNALQKRSARHEFVELDGLDHLFDKDPKVSLEGMYDFMENHWANTSSNL